MKYVEMKITDKTQKQWDRELQFEKFVDCYKCPADKLCDKLTSWDSGWNGNCFDIWILWTKEEDSNEMS